MKTSIFCSSSILIIFFQILFLSEFAAQASVYRRFQPYVIPDTMTTPVLFQIKMNGLGANVVLEIEGQDYPMLDNGTNGDEVANDSIYTISLNPQSIISNMDSTDVFRPFVGYCKPTFNDQFSYKINVFAEIITNEIPRIPICQLNEDVQASPYLINIKRNGIMSIPEIFQTLHELDISSEIDFLNLISVAMKSTGHGYTSLRNNDNGIGIPVFVNSELFTPYIPERFKGFIKYPFSNTFDGANPAAIHELGHQWLAYLGLPYSGCEHWRFSELASSIMGYDYNGNPGCAGLNFSYNFIPATGANNYSLEPIINPIKVYNNLELYLMGLVPADSVQPFLIFSNQHAVQQAALNYNLPGYTGRAYHFTIDDVISNVGERIPVFPDARRDFKTYTIVFSPEFLTEQEMNFYSHFAKRGEAEIPLPFKSGFHKGISAPFYAATHGNGTMDYGIDGLDIHQTIIDTSICSGQNFHLGNSIYSESGSYQQIRPAQNGCDSLITLNLEVMPIFLTSLNASICQGDNYNFHGTILDSSGGFTTTLTAQNGCDSIIELNLDVLPIFLTSTNVSICDGDNYDFNGSLLDSSGIYNANLTADNGCDSTITLTLEVLPVFSTSTNVSICNGDNYDFNGAILNTSGTYVANLLASNGCDSTVTLILDVLPVFSTSTSASICNGDNYDFNGAILNTSGTYIANLMDRNGCDSTVTLVLEVLPPISHTISVAICDNDIYDFNGLILDSAGIYSSIMNSSNGCDSIVTLNLSVNPLNEQVMSASICEGDSIHFNGHFFNSAGVYMDTLAGLNGCDSILTLDLVVVLQPEGGEVSLGDGVVEKMICVGDGISDSLFFKTSSEDELYEYIITDENNNILYVLESNFFDFDNTGNGICRIWGVAFTGNLSAPLGENIDQTELSDECFQLSLNFIKITKDTTGGACLTPVENLNPESLSFTLTPNPADQYIYLSINTNETPLNQATLAVIDASGRLKYTKLLPDVNDDLDLRLEIKEFPDGLYFVIFRMGNLVMYEKFIKAK